MAPVFSVFVLSVMFLAGISVGQNINDYYANLFSENVTVYEPPLTANQTSNEDLPLRLPASLQPIHYLVRLQPFINGNLSFSGYVEISFDVKERTNTIILHINDIITKNETAKVSLLDDSSQMISIVKQEFNQMRQFYIATLSQELKEGETYVLSMNFVGFLNDDLGGFYRSSYKDDEGNTRMLATTQFQPTDARKAFPCFDEPAFKAKFSIEMIREENLTTISNMPLVDSTPVPEQAGWVLDRFNTTFPMSTYLVAFIVSDFDYLEDEDTGNNYTFRVWAKPNGVSSAKYAVELGPKVSRFFEEFFDVPFPLPKQDMAAVPDFSAGAMENWGLIIYRESAFLYDPEVAKAQDKFRIATIISHELAHQWFGDLVTPVWWNDLWLNEGFASYMEYVGLRDTEPSMRALDQFVTKELHRAFALDCLESSHPISIDVENPDDINGIFDAISYSKGASIIRMMSNFLTENTFKRGLSKYLTELSYSSAEQDDLWQYLTDQAHEDGTLDSAMTVKEVMDTWTLQMGYPVISVTRNEDGTATVTQERFLVAKEANSAKKDAHDYKWWIPLTILSQSESSSKDLSPISWMAPSDSSKVLEGMPSSEEWILFNVDQTGYYRVNYDEENWAKIASQLSTDPKTFHDSNRAQIIDDSLYLARAGQLSYETALNLLRYLPNETEYVAIESALNNFEYIKDMFSFTGEYGLLKNYLSSLIIPMYEQVNFEDSLDDPLLDQLKRADVLKWACSLGHKPCVDSAVDLYRQWMQDPENDRLISPNLKSVVYCTAIQEGGAEEWKFAWERYVSTNVGTEQKELLEAMGCTRDIWILAEFLNRTLSPDQGIKKQMVRYIIPAVTRSNIGKMMTWNFLREKWGDVIDYFGSVSFVLDDIVESVTSPLNSKLQLEEMMMFRETYSGKFSSAARSVEQATEHLKNNIHWMENYYDVIVQWLKDNGFKSEI